MSAPLKTARSTGELPAPLKTACTMGDLSHAKSFYNDLVHTNASHVNDPIVYAACDSGSVTIFTILLDNDMDIDKYLEMGGSPLVSSCEAGNVELASFLLDHGADPNNGYFLGDYEALVWAIVGSHASLEMVELLLARGTVVKGTGALIAAAEHGNVGAVNVLLEHEGKNGDLDLEETEDYGAYDHRKLDDRGTALYGAAADGYSEIVDILLQNGADPGFRDRRGRSVADVAGEKGHTDVARKLSSLVAEN